MNVEKKKAAPDDSNIGSGKSKTGGTIYHASKVYDTATNRILQEEKRGECMTQGATDILCNGIPLEELPEDELDALFNAVLGLLPWQTVDGAEAFTNLVGGKILYEIIDGTGFRLLQFVDNDGLFWIRETACGQTGYYEINCQKMISDECPGFLGWLMRNHAPSSEIQFLADSTFYDTGEYAGSLDNKLKALCSDLMYAGYPATEYTVGSAVEALNQAQRGGIKDYQLAALAVAYSIYKAQTGFVGDDDLMSYNTFDLYRNLLESMVPSSLRTSFRQRRGTSSAMP